MSSDDKNRLQGAGVEEGSIRYFGTWKTGGGRRYTGSAYSCCYFTFYGGTVQAYAISGPDKGICTIFLDGEYRATVDCYGEQEDRICIFETSGLPGSAPHNLVVAAGREKNEGSRGTTLEIAGFAAEAPLDYPGELKRRMNTEY
ncbi:MAG: hypothetical protein LBU21_02275, partial [Treponema sp.]|nr:hypothetical protein [Treponema sp.]